MAMPVDNKPGAFQADNGTAEVAASGRYAGRVTTLTVSQAKYDKDRATWAPVALRATTASGSSSVEASVRFGHVLLCSGQSNMQMPVNHFKEGGFAAANGTAEAAAAGRYAGKISLLSLQTPFPRPTAPPWNGTGCGRPNDPGYHPSPACFQPQWNRVSPGPNGTLHGFSAVCWYTGKALLELSGDGAAPLGLIAAAVGGSPIEYWLPPSARVNVNKCESDVPQCDNMYNDSAFYTDQIEQIVP